MDNETLLEKIKAFFGGKERDEEVAGLKEEVARLSAELEATRALVKTNEEIYALIESQVKSGAAGVKAGSDEGLDAVGRVVSAANRRLA